MRLHSLVDELDDIREHGKTIPNTSSHIPNGFFSLSQFEYRPRRLTRKVLAQCTVVARRLPISPLYFYSSGPSGSFPRLRALVLR